MVIITLNLLSKQLAYYWAQQSVRNRSVRIEGTELPVVISVNFPETLNSQVKPDVGAASLLLVEEGEQFMTFLAGIYLDNGFEVPTIDLINADRLEYLNKLGMAYFDADIDASLLGFL